MLDIALGNGDEKDPIIVPEMFIVYIPFNVTIKQFLQNKLYFFLSNYLVRSINRQNLTSGILDYK